ncbi:solute carrier family 23 member 1-like [Mercenaria mercenaria]|uniref:solute carrier family 23 member 1-like n=1 Tax=Mercenaria mercenaria TaxID=6596 RepID=UPI00234F20D6|nr:solute carrier family 23 member 1-like [Mercenaria mercenaria]
MEDKQSRMKTEVNRKRESDNKTKSGVLYTVQESPPWYLCILFGFQHFLTASGSLISLPILLSKFYCMDNDYNALSEIISTVFFVSGIVTLLQTTFGIRLPILQGVSASFLTPIISILNQPQWKCPYTEAREKYGANVTFTDVGLPAVGSTGHQEIWHKRIREVQGAIIVASLFQIVIGFTGVMGFALRFFGPLVITPTLVLVGLSLFQTGAVLASQQWWIALMTMLLITIFSQYLRKVEMPCFPCWNKRNETPLKLPVFTLFPVLMAMLISWGVCAILTATGVLPENPGEWGYAARTDRSLQVLRNADFFRFPYPGQWGLPTVTVASVFGVLAGVLAAMLESIGDYYACAKLSGAPPPPAHAIIRAILVEGFGCFLAGIWGTGQGTTSFGQNTGTIGITKVGSRIVVQIAACIMIVLGCFGKFGAVFASIPQPIVGGVFMVTFGMITGVGLSNLQYVNLNSPRNIYIVGLSIFFGLSLPVWMKGHPDAINTGSDVADQILSVLLGTNMFVGATVAFILDNTVPGTLEERGIIAWLQEGTTNTETIVNRKRVYGLPLIQKGLDNISALKYFPICPSFSKEKESTTQSSIEQKQSVSDMRDSDLSGVDNKTFDLDIDLDTRM